MAESDEKGFEVIDKRKKPEEQAAESELEKNEEPEEPTGDAESSEQTEPEHEAIQVNVYSLMQWMIAMLSESAWHAMGLQMDPATKTIQKDLAQAKSAVDTVVFMVDQVAPHCSEEQRKEYRSLVTNLRVNFVQQQSKSAEE